MTINTDVTFQSGPVLDPSIIHSILKAYNKYLKVNSLSLHYFIQVNYPTTRGTIHPSKLQQGIVRTLQCVYLTPDNLTHVAPNVDSEKIKLLRVLFVCFYFINESSVDINTSVTKTEKVVTWKNLSDHLEVT